MLQTVDEVAAYMKVPRPDVYDVTEKPPYYAGLLAYVYPDKLLIDMEFFCQLTHAEQKSALGHELRHSQQNALGIAGSKLFGRMVQSMANHLDQRDFSDSAVRALHSVEQSCLKRIATYEKQADEAGAEVGDPKALATVLLKYIAFLSNKVYNDVKIDLRQDRVAIAQQLAEIRDRPLIARVYDEGRFQERIHALDLIAKACEEDQVIKEGRGIS